MLNIIVAVASNDGIGMNNEIPWKLPNDLQYFKETTVGHTVVMGRKTFDSLPFGLLKFRENIVLTRTPEKEHETDDIAMILEKAKHQDVFIMGGAEIYNLFYPYADKLYLTHVQELYRCDTFFDWYEGHWDLLAMCKGLKNIDNPHDYYFKLYKRKLETKWNI